MKKICLYFICASLILGCQHSTKNTNVELTRDSILLIHPIDSLLTKFIQANNNASQYHLIIYLVGSQKIITFIATNITNSTEYKNMALLYFIFNGKKVYLITGIEDSFLPKKYSQSKNLHNSINVNSDSKFWKMESYILRNNQIKYIPYGIPPFSPPPSDLVLPNPLAGAYRH